MPQAMADVDPAVLDGILLEILDSPFFRSSAQCSALLRYIVENTLLERDECLRERVIGCEVFHRPAHYDTGNDHIVRSRASEVRKRLAQFYQDPGAHPAIKISIPAGSYRAVFEVADRSDFRQDVPAAPQVADDCSLDLESTLPEPVATPPPPPTATPLVQEFSQVAATSPVTLSRLHYYRSAALLAAIILLTASVFWASKAFEASHSNFRKFWSPLVTSQKPVLIYCGGGFVYKLSDKFLDEYRQRNQLRDTRREFFVDLKPGETVDSKELMPDRHFVPFGDLASAARIASTLSLAGKPYDLRYGDDVAFTDLRSSPVILIGGLNNNWALRMTKNLRFVLDEDDRIVDRWHPEKPWVHKTDADNSTQDDYAVISRLSQSETGGFVLSVAGIRMYGTRAATDLITDTATLDRILKTAPQGWQNKNLQIVIHTRTLNEITTSTSVESVYFW